ncbi:type II toxin-antitoxin system prevent-host-death family antitoxin [Arachnia propionica]|uniref:Antitoxin n=1 Tax=Arachnia propionica TaxID=1750 RepID=A0A3P1T3Z3_9ACTN|nr:type II toxin-antitoxin system prevent-host-death family antitoxin [Arachnia propionica]RRD04191.1 type II toxin-antitoxin system prevent-host-death family antitoxin [Arachnia propionica]
MATVSMSVARQTFAEQLARVEAGEEIEITRHGKVAAVLVHPRVLRARRASSAWARADEIAALLDRARTEPIPAQGLSPERADELVDGIRAERSRR